MNRRSFLAATGATLAHDAGPRITWGLAAPEHSPDLRLRIEPCTLDIGRGVQINTVAYNGQIPGPLLRLKKGKPVTIDVTNASKNPDLVLSPGLTTDSLNDGAVEA